MAEEKTRILLVEDDFNLGFVIRDNLNEAGYSVSLVSDGNKGLEAFYNSTFDLCILDVMLPSMDGFSLAEQIRRKDQDVPVIFLTAKSLAEDKIKGFKSGGDDYITKPFNIEELLLRIEAILKRAGNKAQKAVKKDEFEIGKYLFDYKNLSLIYGSDKKTLTKKEAELLRLLCIHENEILERETALKVVWGNNDYFLGRSMDVFIARLRKYLKQDERIKIANVHGIGFRLHIL